MASHLVYIRAEYEPALINEANKAGMMPDAYLKMICEKHLRSLGGDKSG